MYRESDRDDSRRVIYACSNKSCKRDETCGELGVQWTGGD
jgi:hypothetical protein